MSKCCDVDEGDDYCEDCIQKLKEHQTLTEKLREMPPTNQLETPEGQLQVLEALKTVAIMVAISNAAIEAAEEPDAS